jgi:hypothetical protein
MSKTVQQAGTARHSTTREICRQGTSQYAEGLKYNVAENSDKITPFVIEWWP